MSDLQALQARLQYQFKDEGLLRLALTHPLLAHEQGASSAHNQRLEFLGDAVLGLAITSELYQRFPDVSEGPLTKARAQMINRRTLAEQARRLDLQTHLIMSRSEEANWGAPALRRWLTGSKRWWARFIWTAAWRRPEAFCCVHFWKRSGS